MKFVGFGCSWMYGSELLDPSLALDGVGLDYDANWEYYGTLWHENTPYREEHCFLGQLADNTENLGDPGNSLKGMFYQFMKHQNHSNPDTTFYIFGFTQANRESWYDRDTKRWKHSTWVENGTSIHNVDMFRNSYKEYLANTWSDEWEEYQYTAMVSSMIAVCKSKGFRYVGFDSLPNKYQVKDSNIFWSGYSMKEALDEQEKNGKNVFHAGGHPNELGHKWIAGRVKEFIDTAYPGLL